MNKKPRKSLGDSLAQEFVYGEKMARPVNNQEQPASETPPPPVEQPITEVPTLPKPTESTLATMFQTEAKEATIRFTVDLPESMHRKLSILAARTGKKKAEIVRMLLDETLKDVEE